MDKFYFTLCDDRFNVIAREKYASKEEAMEVQPNAEFILAADYVTRERCYISLKNKFQYCINEKDVEEVKKSGAYIAIEGPYFTMFIKRAEDGIYTKNRIKSEATLFTFDEAMEFAANYTGDEKLYIVKVTKSLKANPVYWVLPDSEKEKLNEDSFYRGDVAFFVH